MRGWQFLITALYNGDARTQKCGLVLYASRTISAAADTSIRPGGLRRILSQRQAALFAQASQVGFCVGRVHISYMQTSKLSNQQAASERRGNDRSPIGSIGAERGASDHKNIAFLSRTWELMGELRVRIWKPAAGTTQVYHQHINDQHRCWFVNGVLP